MFACWACTLYIQHREIIINGINAIDTFKSFINNILITKYLTCELCKALDYNAALHATKYTLLGFNGLFNNL